jgi:hypothetical protein
MNTLHYKWPRRRCAAEQRDELAPFQVSELHLVLYSQGGFAGYRMGRDQSAGIGALASRSQLRWGIAREMNEQQTGARSCATDRESARWRSHDRFGGIDTAAS